MRRVRVRLNGPGPVGPHRWVVSIEAFEAETVEAAYAWVISHFPGVQWNPQVRGEGWVDLDVPLGGDTPGSAGARALL